jgi:hypothetical protein
VLLLLLRLLLVLVLVGKLLLVVLHVGVGALRGNTDTNVRDPSTHAPNQIRMHQDNGVLKSKGRRHRRVG